MRNGSPRRTGVRRFGTLGMLAALVVGVLVFAACAPDEESEAVPEERAEEPEEVVDEEADEVGEEAEGSGEPEQSEITVATIPIMAMAPFFYAMEQGLFEEEGLEVTHAVGSGGAALIPRILAGEIDIFWTALEPFVVARSEGVELDVVAPGHFYQAVDGGALGVFALPDSGFESMADLEGATIGINTLNTFGHIFTQAALQHQGIDLDTIRWVEVEFPQMPPALERGEVDAVWAPEPFITIMKNNLGAVALLDPTADDDIMADLPAFRGPPGGAWAASHDFAQVNPNTVAAFDRAIRRANMVIQEDKDAAIEVLLANTEMQEGIVRQAAWPVWSEDLDLPERVQITADLMHEFGILDEPLDTSGFMHETVLR